MKSLDKFYDRAKKTWFATQDVGRGSALTLNMPPILEATRCTALPPAQLDAHAPPRDAEMYLARRRAAARGAHVRAQHAVHAGLALGAGAAPRA